MLSHQESHQVWCDQIKDQSVWPDPFDHGYDEKVNVSIRNALSMSWHNRGNGAYDRLYTADECWNTYHAWDYTDATTPDLIPRVVFGTVLEIWHRVVWRLMNLMGPCNLAMRPSIWRGAAAVPLYKKGVVHDSAGDCEGQSR